MTIIDPHKNNLPKLCRDCAKSGYLLGYSNHSKICLYWSKDSPTTIKRSAHCVIEDVQTMKQLEPGFIEISNPVTQPTGIKTNIIDPSHIDVLPTPFAKEDIHTVTVRSPKYPQNLGMITRNDLVTNLPYLQKSKLNLFIYNTLDLIDVVNKLSEEFEFKVLNWACKR